MQELAIVLLGSAVLAVIGGGWLEIRSLRASRHDHAQRLTALTGTVETVQADVTELKHDVRVVRDGLIRARVIEPESL